MKIAYFSDNFYPELSGVSDSLLLLGKEMARRGHEVHFFAPRYGAKEYARVGQQDKEPELPPNVFIHRLASLPATSPTGQGRAALPKIWRGLLPGTHFDIVHSHQFFGTGIDGLCLAKTRGIPFVGTNHTLIESFSDYNPIKAAWATRLLKRYMLWYYNQCDLVTAPSQFLIDEMETAGLHWDHRVISNPVEPEYFERTHSKETLKKKFGFAPFTILYIGRIATEKGVDELFRGFVELRKTVPDAMLVFVGGGVTKKDLMHKVELQNMGESVKFMGPYIGADKKILPELYQAADVFGSASTSEIQSMTMLQSMASALPIVAARAGGTPSFLHKGGMLFEPGSIADMVSCFKELHDDKTLRAAIGEEGHAESLKISAERIGKTWEDAYTDLIAKKKGTARQKKTHGSKNVVIFGVFDGLHDGHHFFINRALRLGGTLSIIVTPDAVVRAMKRRMPEMPLEERIQALRNAFPQTTVLPGDLKNTAWQVLEATRPAIIALGYDQKSLRKAIEAYYAKRKDRPEIVTIEDHRGDELHSSILRTKK